MLYAIIDEEVFKIVWRRDLDFMLTFERDEVRYQRKLGDCDVAHIRALTDAMGAYVAISAAGGTVGGAVSPHGSNGLKYDHHPRPRKVYSPPDRTRKGARRALSHAQRSDLGCVV